MLQITKFEWRGGKPLEDLVVNAHEVPDGSPQLVIKTLDVHVEGNRGSIRILLGSPTKNNTDGVPGGHDFFWKRVYPKLGANGSSTCNVTTICFSAEPGTPITQTMMEKLLLLLELCEIYGVPAPRIVSESFVVDGRSREPYGKHLMKKVRRQMALAV